VSWKREEVNDTLARHPSGKLHISDPAAETEYKHLPMSWNLGKLVSSVPIQDVCQRRQLLYMSILYVL
jgi:hypothetical protein